MYARRIALVGFVLASLALVQTTTAVAASGYTLFGDAQIVSGGHPGNAAQIRSSATPPGYGGVDFSTQSGLTVGGLNNLSTDYKFTAGSCGGGAPRFQINVGGANIFVYIGPPPNYTGCPIDGWVNTGNLLTPLSLVDTSQLPGGTFYDVWALAQARYSGLAVSGIQLVTDGSWAVGGVQTVLVDNVQINDDTFTFETKDSCKNGGWRDFGTFKNQGDCVSSFANGK